MCVVCVMCVCVVCVCVCMCVCVVCVVRVCVCVKLLLTDFQLLDGMNQVKFDNSLRCVIMRSEVPGVFCAGAYSEFLPLLHCFPICLFDF